MNGVCIILDYQRIDGTEDPTLDAEDWIAAFFSHADRILIGEVTCSNG